MEGKVEPTDIGIVDIGIEDSGAAKKRPKLVLRLGQNYDPMNLLNIEPVDILGPVNISLDECALVLGKTPNQRVLHGKVIRGAALTDCGTHQNLTTISKRGQGMGNDAPNDPTADEADAYVAALFAKHGFPSSEETKAAIRKTSAEIKKSAEELGKILPRRPRPL